MEMIKKFWKTPFLSFGLWMLCTSSIFLIRSFYSFHINIVIGLIAFMLLTYWVRRKAVGSRKKIIHTCLLLTPPVALSVLAFFRPIIIYSPGLIFAPALGVLLGYLISRPIGKPVKIAIALMPIFIGLWVYVRFADIWQEYVIYGTFRSGETMRECPQFTFLKDSVPVGNDAFKGKTTVFFIWNTQCIYTPRYIPALKEKFEKYVDDEGIDFYLVNVPLAGDTVGADVDYLAAHDLEIENLTGPGNDEMYKLFGPGAYPQTMILNPEGNIVFWGSITKIDRTLRRQ